MGNLISPNDLENIGLVEEKEILRIKDFLKQAKNEWKLALLYSQIDILGTEVRLCTTKTRFGGERLWFVCPQCQRRVGNLYRDIGVTGCRKCLGLRYWKQMSKVV